MGNWQRLCSVSEISIGEMRSFLLDSQRILLVNLDGKFHAVDGTCTHEEADLGGGFLLGEEVTCPLHLSRFNLRTGEVLSPPATQPLRVFNLKIQDSGIFVEV
jgi:3-phenylpropionate/trans-cinnamate dioxygenase ferredoxin subunit